MTRGSVPTLFDLSEAIERTCTAAEDSHSAHQAYFFCESTRFSNWWRTGLYHPRFKAWSASPVSVSLLPALTRIGFLRMNRRKKSVSARYTVGLKKRQRAPEKIPSVLMWGAQLHSTAIYAARPVLRPLTYPANLNPQELKHKPS